MATRGPEPDVTDPEIITAVERGQRPFVTINEVSRRVDLSGTRARERMNALVESGELEKAKVGGRAVVYWLPDE